MKIVAIFVAILAASLAAPRDVPSNGEKMVKPVEAVGSEKYVPNLKVIEKPTSDSDPDSLSEEKVAVESVDESDDEVKEDEVDKAEEEIVEEQLDDEQIEPEIVVPKEETAAHDSANEKERKGRKKASAELTAAEEESEKDLDEYSAVCRASTGATIEQISEISEDPVEDAPRAVKCYVKCIAEHLGLVKEHVLQKDIAVASKPSTLSTDELDSAVDACSNLKTDDPCDSSYLRYSCYFRATGKKVRIF